MTVLKPNFLFSDFLLFYSIYLDLNGNKILGE